MYKRQVRGNIKGGNEAHVFMDVPVGISVGELIEMAGGLDKEDSVGEIIMGGAFTGRAAAVSYTHLDVYKRQGYDFVRYSDIAFGEKDKAVADDILNILLEEKRIVKVSDDLYTLTEYMEKAKTMIQEEFKKREVITTAEVRDLFQTSRKSAKPIIEYMDSIKVTKRVGAESERVAY